MQVRKANSRQMLVLQEEEIYNAMLASLQGTLPETVSIEQVFKKAPERQVRCSHRPTAGLQQAFKGDRTLSIRNQ